MTEKEIQASDEEMEQFNVSQNEKCVSGKKEKLNDLMNKISLSLKDGTLQQGFEIICKRIAELEKENEQLKIDIEIADRKEMKVRRMIDKSLINKSIEFYGPEMQSCVCMEEAAELIQAISKIKRYGIDEKKRDHLVEKMADVLICIELLKSIYGIDEAQLDKWITKKQVRTTERMEQGRK